MAWHINAETCLNFWADNGMDCSNFIRSWAFNKPTAVQHDMVRWGIHNTPVLHKLFLWGDDVFGYGIKGNTDNFWEI